MLNSNLRSIFWYHLDSPEINKNQLDADQMKIFAMIEKTIDLSFHVWKFWMRVWHFSCSLPSIFQLTDIMILRDEYLEMWLMTTVLAWLLMHILTLHFRCWRTELRMVDPSKNVTSTTPFRASMGCQFHHQTVPSWLLENIDLVSPELWSYRSLNLKRSDPNMECLERHFLMGQPLGAPLLRLFWSTWDEQRVIWVMTPYLCPFDFLCLSHTTIHSAQDSHTWSIAGK